MSADRNEGWGRLSVFYLGNVLFASGLFVHAFSFNFYLRELGYSAVVMGHQVTAMTLGGLVALAPAGYVIDRFGTRTALLIGVVVTAIALAVTALVRERSAIHLGAAFVGVGGATVRVSWGPAMMRLADATRRARAFTWNVALLIASSSVWTMLAGDLPERFAPLAARTGLTGTQLVLLGGAAITALALLCYWPMHLTREPARPARARPLALPPEVRALVPSIAFWMLATALIAPFFNVFFVDRFSVSVRWTGTLFAISHVVTAIVLVGAAEIAKRWGPQRALAWWIVAFAPALWVLSVTDAVSLAVFLYVIQGLVAPATNPLIDQLVLERVDRSRHGAVAAWRNAAGEASGALGASVGGYVLAATSFNTLFVTAGALGAVSGFVLCAILRAEPVRTDTDTLAATR